MNEDVKKIFILEYTYNLKENFRDNEAIKSEIIEYIFKHITEIVYLISFSQKNSKVCI